MEIARRLLLVDDELEIIKPLQDLFESSSYLTHTAESADEALDILRGNEIDILITDYRMPGKDGLELVDAAREIKPNLQCMIFTGHGDLNTVIGALKLGACDFFMKPINFEERENAILDGMSRAQLISELKEKQKEVKELSRKLTAARKEKEAADKTKSEFLSIASHEIRTPISGILGMTYLLQKTDLDTKQAELCDMLRYSGENLLHLVNDILDLSKMESGKLELECIDFDPWKLVRETVKSIEMIVGAKGVELICDIDPCVPSILQGDPQRFRQILLNLLGNAIKFTERGCIKVSLMVREEKKQTVILKCRVKDTGIGISREAQKHIFDSFSQADNSISRKFGGTGLGLNIAKNLTSLMGGEIGVESEPEQETTFWFTAVMKNRG